MKSEKTELRMNMSEQTYTNIRIYHFIQHMTVTEEHRLSNIQLSAA